MHRSHATVARSGFTLVELLVVIAIMAALIALLVPAIQSARESARRMHCRGNLRQIALACSSFATRQGDNPSLPGAGSSGGERLGDPNAVSAGGWLYTILPFVEQLPLFNLGTGKTGTALNADITTRVGTPLPIYVCPNRGAALFQTPNVNFRTGGGAAINPRPPVAARTDYAGCWSARGIRYPNGGSGALDYWDYSSEKPRQLRSITDGRSNVFLCGERYLDPAQYVPTATVNAECNNRGWSVGHESDVYSAVSERDPINTSASVPVPPLPDTVGTNRCDADRSMAGTFGGPHRALHMAMVDGAVRAVDFAIDPNVFRALGHISDNSGTVEALE